MSRTITFKVSLAPDHEGPVITRRLPGSLSTPFESFINEASARFGLSVHAVRWTDEDGDDITMSSDVEWQDMIDSLPSGTSTVRLSIVPTPQHADTSSTATATSAVTPTSLEGVPNAAAPEPADAIISTVNAPISAITSVVDVQNEEDYDKIDLESISDAGSDVGLGLRAAEALIDSETDTATQASGPPQQMTNDQPKDVQDEATQDPPEENLSGSQPSPGSSLNLVDLLSTLPAQLQTFATDFGGLLQNPAQLPQELPAFARSVQQELGQVFADVLIGVQAEAERARADYDKFRKDLENEKQKLASEIQAKFADFERARASGPASEAAAADTACHDDTSEEERRKEERRQEARDARRRQREEKQRDAVRQGKKAERSERGNVQTSASEAASNPTSPPGLKATPSPGPSQSWRIPGAFVHSSAVPTSTPWSATSWAEVTPNQIRAALVELGFDAYNNLGARIACERAWEINRGKSLKEMVEAAVEMLL
ncbi:hypothetical protein OIO90_002465 [Microbotryomycetes sp. JL221]|nr:hypothetical protein OIO90_002465 [Microbotryomycetes sp. JL221]